MPEKENADRIQNSDELEQVRMLLFQKEIELMHRLEKRLEDHASQAEDVSKVLVEAVVMRNQKDNLLSKALEPIIESSLRDTVRKKPQDLTNTLFPLIGATIRRSIAETFRSMLGSFSQSLEFSFSPKGIRWRLEALRTGKPFSEIVMLHTLVYRVEQIYLIHNETGLVLTHVINSGVASNDADMVSGMLTAIQDFAKDCFASNNERSLNSLEMEDYSIYIERGPYAYLASVVRGAPPAEYLRHIRETLETVHLKCGSLLEDFNGDIEPFVVANPHLEDCLEEHFVDKEKKLALWVKALPVIMLSVFLGLVGYKIYHTHKMNQAVEIIRNEPGVLLFNIKSHFIPKPWEVSCLLDENTHLHKALAQNNIDPNSIIINSTPFISHDPEIVRRRLQQRLISVPDSVQYDVIDGVAIFRGSADMSWILQARQIAESIPGVNVIDMDNLIDPRFAQLQKMVDTVEQTKIRFVLGRSTPIAEDEEKLNNLVGQLVALEKLARQMGLAANLTIYGHADATGHERRNYEISQERATSIAAMLYSLGSSMPIAIYGMGANYAHLPGNNTDARTIEMRIHLTQAADVDQFLRKRPIESTTEPIIRDVPLES